MATTEMVSSYPSWISDRWTANLFDNVRTLTLVEATATAPVWPGPTTTTNYINAMHTAIAELLAIDVRVLWDELITKYHVMAHIGTMHESSVVTYLGAETKVEIFTQEVRDIPRAEYVHHVAGKGQELYDRLLEKEGDLLDNLSQQLSIVNEAVSAGLVNVYQKAFEQHLSKGTIWSSVCYNWILERYDQILGANREYTNKAVLDLLDKRLDRTARLIEISGQTHGQGKQLVIAKDKMVLDSYVGSAERAGKIVELSSASYEKSHALRHEVAGAVLQNTLQVEELQGKMKSTISELQYQMDMEIAKTAYAALITSKRWKLDNSKYLMEAMAALQGASPQSRSSSESGWGAMSSTERTLSMASVGVSLASGVASIFKDLF